jgi:replicative DNA helicase
MQADKVVLQRLFSRGSMELYSGLKVEFFNRKAPKVIFKALRSYVDTYHKLPSLELFASKLKAKLPKGTEDIYLGFLDGLSSAEVEASDKEILQTLKDEYLLTVLDTSLEGLVMAANDRNLPMVKNLLSNLESNLTTTNKLPEDISVAEYSPSKIKLIDPFLDSMRVTGLKLGGLTLIGGTSGGGKSVMLLQQLMYNFEQGHDVCLLNLELGRDETIARMYAMATKREFAEVYGRTDKATVAEIDAWRSKYFDRANTFYIQNTSFDTQEIENIVRAMVVKGVHIFGVDYLNLVELTTEEDWKGLSRLVKNLHRLSQELSLVVITPTQVNLTDTKEKDGELKITTRGSRELEFSATVFLFIYQTSDEYEEGMARIFTIKARNGVKKTYIVETDFTRMQFKDTGMVL